MGETTGYILAKLVLTQIVGKSHAVFLEDQDVSAAAGSIETLRLPFVHEQPGSDRHGILVGPFAIALSDVTDHHRHDFNHGNQAGGCAARDIRIDDCDNTFVFRVGSAFSNDCLGVAGVITACEGINIDHLATDRSVVVVVFVRGEPEDGEIAAPESIQPGRFVCTEEFIEAEKFFLDEKL